MKLGIAVNDLGPSQLSFLLIHKVNQLVGSRADVDVVAFYDNMARPCLPMNFAAMQIAEGWGFDGPMVATTFRTAEKLLRFPSCSKKLFYSWDLDWLRMKPKAFRQLLPIYGSPELTILARSTDHGAVIATCFNREVTVVEDFDIDQLIEVARG